MSFFEELKRRNVFRVGAAYAVTAWVLLQVLDVVGEILELPAWGGKLIGGEDADAAVVGHGESQT